MTKVMTFSPAEVVPEREAVLANQGIPPRTAFPPGIEDLYAASFELLAEVADPAAVLAEISKEDFEAVYRGEGLNEPLTPVGDVFPRADHLATFVATLGQRVSEKIDACFRANELALGAILDAIASSAADKLAATVEDSFLSLLSQTARSTPVTRVLRYSPGYCGWHLSAQRKLFGFLRPETIGIRLRESFLMQPLKSVSGVLIAGPREIHSPPRSYPFCSHCDSQGCRERMQALMGNEN
jgi:hypothetical protein